MVRASLYEAQYAPIYLSSLQKQPLISIRETVGSTRKQLICIGENYLYCLNQKHSNFFRPTKAKTQTYFRTISVYNLKDKDNHTSTHTHQKHYTNKQTHTNHSTKKLSLGDCFLLKVRHSLFRSSLFF